MNARTQDNWWSRNWKWFVPTGCLTVLAMFVGSIALVVYFVFGMMKSSDVYVDALAKARSSPAVVEALGNPIEEGWLISGNVEVSGSSGKADLSFPVSGPKGAGTVYVVASKSAGQWHYSTLQVKLDKSTERIDLLR